MVALLNAVALLANELLQLSGRRTARRGRMDYAADSAAELSR